MEKNGKIFNSLWIIASFIIYFNGLGFVYIGSKTRNEKWFMEGCIYEIPWLLLIIETGLINSSIGTYIVGLGLLLVIVSIIRSIMVNPEYQKALNNGNYRKSRNRITSLLFFIFSAIPIINGIPMIVFGFTNSDRNKVIEGIIYEIPWALLFITVYNDFLGNIFAMFGLALNLVSIIRSIMVNYEMENLSLDVFYENTSQSSIKTPIQSEVEINEDIKENKAPNEESPYKDKLPEINNLSEEFKTKENKASQLIEKRFKSSELTYDKFKSVLTMEIINLSSHKNEKLDSELSKRINALESILEKVNRLIEALVIDSIESRESEEDLKVLVEDMENLINSVEDYN